MSEYTSSDAEATFAACATIPEGMAVTCGDLAALVGRPRDHALPVAMMLGNRPYAGTDLDPLPWWRVVRQDGSLLDADQITGPRAQWVGWALDKLSEEGVPLLGEGVHRRVDLSGAVRMPIPDGIPAWQSTQGTQRPRPSRPRVQPREPEPCWRHDKMQYSCRDCTR